MFVEEKLNANLTVVEIRMIVWTLRYFFLNSVHAEDSISGFNVRAFEDGGFTFHSPESLGIDRPGYVWPQEPTSHDHLEFWIVTLSTLDVAYHPGLDDVTLFQDFQDCQ